MKKKKIAITLRVENIEKIHEKRDALSQDWIRFLEKMNIMPILLPNNLKNLDEFLNEMKVDGIILSGGDNMGEFPERDKTEEELIEYAKKTNLPILGICRGMQVLNKYFGGELEKSKSSEHVVKSHRIEFTNEKISNFFDKESIEVNSFHNNLILKENIGSELEVFAIAKNDHTVEGFFHKKFPFIGVMWHPERDENIDNESKIVEIFCEKRLWDY